MTVCGREPSTGELLVGLLRRSLTVAFCACRLHVCCIMHAVDCMPTVGQLSSHEATQRAWAFARVRCASHFTPRAFNATQRCRGVCHVIVGGARSRIDMWLVPLPPPATPRFEPSRLAWLFSVYSLALVVSPLILLLSSPSILSNARTCVRACVCACVRVCVSSVRCTQAVANGYFDNPYHNFRHGVDVMQIMCYYLERLNLTTIADLSTRQVRAALVAALGHDIGHTGRTNNFLVVRAACPSACPSACLLAGLPACLSACLLPVCCLSAACLLFGFVSLHAFLVPPSFPAFLPPLCLSAWLSMCLSTAACSV